MRGRRSLRSLHLFWSKASDPDHSRRTPIHSICRDGRFPAISFSYAPHEVIFIHLQYNTFYGANQVLLRGISMAATARKRNSPAITMKDGSDGGITVETVADGVNQRA